MAETEVKRGRKKKSEIQETPEIEEVTPEIQAMIDRSNELARQRREAEEARRKEEAEARKKAEAEARRKARAEKAAADRKRAEDEARGMAIPERTDLRYLREFGMCARLGCWAIVILDTSVDRVLPGSYYSTLEEARRWFELGRGCKDPGTFVALIDSDGVLDLY